MILSDSIARMIEEMLNNADGELELRRNELASRLGCVPSQISYVITSRFTPERGYIIESRRGGGGCIRIIKKQMQKNEYLMHFFQAIGNSVDENTAGAFVSNLADAGIVTGREESIVENAVSDSSLSKLAPDARNIVRADILRHIILSLMD